MAGKKYATKQQRELLESLGYAHSPGRTFEQAKGIIDDAIAAGTLAADCMEATATPKQLEYMASLGISPPDRLTKKKATAMIDAAIKTRNATLPITDRQYEFIFELGGIPDRGMNRAAAGEYIDYLLENVACCGRCSLRHNRREERCRNCGAYLPQGGLLPPPFAITPIEPQSHSRETPTVWQQFSAFFKR